MEIAAYILSMARSENRRPTVLHSDIRKPVARRTAMKTKNPLTVRPGSGSGLAELKRAESLIRLTESILGTPMPARNRTDEQGRKQGYWVEREPHGTVREGLYVDGKRHGHWVLRIVRGYFLGLTQITTPYPS